MRKGMLETRKRMFREKMNDPAYLETSYERAKKAREKRFKNNVEEDN